MNSARGRKMAVRPTMMLRLHHAPEAGSPLTIARVRLVAEVSGDIQARRCTASGNESSGKKTPLKKNMGVMNRVK